MACKVPPKGWYCTRDEGHDGPCAAWSSKKHIIISREGGDFSMDLIFAGLVRRFGKDSVIDYPARAKHRQGKPSLIGDDEKDYGAERRSLCYVEDCEDMREWTRPEIIQEIMSGNIETVFLDETDSSYHHFIELFLNTKKEKEINVQVIAGHDNFRGDPKQVITRFGNHATLFIDDWKQEYDNLPNTRLINLSCNFDHLWDVSKREEYLANKKYDICFIGYNSNPVRKVVIDHINKKWGHLNNCIIFEERQDKFDKFIRHEEMFKLMAQSKICLNLPGASTGGRALRYYEIPYVGSMMISQEIHAKLLDPPMGIKFDSLTDLDETIQFYLDNPSLRDTVAVIDRARSLNNHSIDARMDYIFEIING